jgi:hypothetical protein
LPLPKNKAAISSFFQKYVNALRSASLLLVIRMNRRLFNKNISKENKMKNLIAALVASLFAVSAFAASHTAAPAAPMADAKAAPMADAPKAKKAKKHHHKMKKAMKADAAAPAEAPAAK